MKNDTPKAAKTILPKNTGDGKELSQKLKELEIQKEKLEETIKAREEQLLNLFSYIQTSVKP